MGLKQTIRKILSEHNKDKDKKIRDIILNATEWDDFISALAIKYGDTVPLYHATTKETAEIIDREGFKLTYGKNYKSFTREELIYFQIGNSDYQASNRPVLYRLDVPLDFIAEFADIDMDNVDISDEDLAEVGVDMEYWDDMSYEIKDVISYYVWNNMTLDGMELLITDRNSKGDIFKGLIPVKVSQLDESTFFKSETNSVILENSDNLVLKIKKLLNKKIKEKYEKIICRIEVIPPGNVSFYLSGEETKDYIVRVVFREIPEIGASVERETIYEILDECWDWVYNFINIHVNLYFKKEPNCGEPPIQS